MNWIERNFIRSSEWKIGGFYVEKIYSVLSPSEQNISSTKKQILNYEHSN